MKKIFIIILLVFSATTSCNESKWLEEVAYDFYSADNSYVNESQINAAVVKLYERIEPFYSFWPPYLGNAFFYTSDIAYDAIAITHQMNSYEDKLIPEMEMVSVFWQSFYKNISNANMIINRIDGGYVEFTNEKQGLRLKAEAMFFRAFNYRFLGILYGGVPLVLDVVNEPKRDFVRNSESEVWDQVLEDLLFAEQYLPEVTELDQDGRLTKSAANHLLAEIYLIRKEYDMSIAASSKVIDNPNFSLMTNRFGASADDPGDVYWDLFRRGNQNRNGGVNSEAIWVKQYEYQTEGADADYRLTWVLVPSYYLLKDEDGKSLFIGPTSKYGGDGGGWMVATDYMLHEVWQDDPNDMRNSSHNIIRDIAADNPESKYYGRNIIESGAINGFPNTLNRWWSAIFAKSTPINDFPKEVILDEATGLVSSGAQSTFRDHYIFRLAETHLLRAEAYLGKGELSKAAEDINVVRARANALPIAVNEVSLDYILDERARELNFEEPRLLTLMRMGKLVEKVKLHDPMHNGKYANHGISEKHGKWPIPQSEIERNTEAELEQNPDY